MRATCRARLPDATGAEDAVQDTLLTIHRARDSCNAAHPFRLSGVLQTLETAAP